MITFGLKRQPTMTQSALADAPLQFNAPSTAVPASATSVSVSDNTNTVSAPAKRKRAWTKHFAADDLVFFFDPSTQECTWDIPSDYESDTNDRHAAVERRKRNKLEPQFSTTHTSELEPAEAFVVMLEERNVSPSATFEKELPKMAVDARYALLKPHAERKKVFETWAAEKLAKTRKIQEQRLQVRYLL